MVNKLLVTVFEHIKNVDSVSDVCISSQSLTVYVGVDDEKVPRLERLAHILGLTVVISPYSQTHFTITFYL